MLTANVLGGAPAVWLRQLANATRRRRWPQRLLGVALAAALFALVGCGLAGGAGSVGGAPGGKGASGAGAAGVTMVNWSAPFSATMADALFAPSDPQVGYACVGPSPTQTSQPRFYTSVDGGQNWRADDTTPDLGMPCRVFIDPKSASDIFLQEVQPSTTGSGDPLSATFWRSQDGGASWRQLALPPHSNGWGSFAVVGARLIGAIQPVFYGAAGCSATTLQKPPTNNLLASDDSGVTWNQIGQRMTSAGLDVSTFVSAGQALFASVATHPTTCGQTTYATYWRSTDDGASWAAAALSSKTNILSMSFTAMGNGQGEYGVALEQPNVAPNARSGAPITTLISDDSGASWRPAPTFATPDGKPATSFSVQFGALSRTPAGDAVAAIDLIPANPASAVGSTTYLFLLRLRTGAPGWYQYTPAPVSQQIGWQITHTAQGDLLTAAGYDPNQSDAVASIPLPA